MCQKLAHYDIHTMKFPGLNHTFPVENSSVESMALIPILGTLKLAYLKVHVLGPLLFLIECTRMLCYLRSYDEECIIAPADPFCLLFCVFCVFMNINTYVKLLP